MQILTFEELAAVDNFGGGMSDQHCQAVWAMSGIVVGGIAAGVASGGLFSWGGAQIGGMLGGVGGLVFCGGHIKNAPKPA